MVIRRQRPRILFLVHLFPRPTSGLGLRIRTFLKALSKDWDITFVTRCPRDIKQEEISDLKSICSEVVTIPGDSFKLCGPLLRLLSSESKFLKAIPMILSRKPIFLNNNIFLTSEILQNYLKTVNWSDFDVVHVERIGLVDAILPYITIIKREKVFAVLDLDEMDSKVRSRSFSYSSSKPFGRFIRRCDLKRLQRYEARIIPLFDASIVSSDIEMDNITDLKLSSSPWVIPNSIDTCHFKPNFHEYNGNFDLLYVGLMSYGPNIDAVGYFVKKIFPLILERVPSARLFIVGRNPSEDVLGLHDGKNIIVTSEVADTRIYHEQCPLFVAPIRYGGGTRIKILEAMAMGKAVVSTSVGIEGIPARDGKEVVISDNEEDFAANCVKLLLDHARRSEIGHHAREFVCKYFAQDIIQKKIQHLYSSVKRS